MRWCSQRTGQSDPPSAPHTAAQSQWGRRGTVEEGEERGGGGEEGEEWGKVGKFTSN